MESWTRRQNPVNKPDPDSLSEQIQSLLPQVEDQANELPLKQVWLSLEMRRIQTRLLQVDKLFYAKSVTPLKSKTKQTEEPQIGMSPLSTTL